MVAKLVNPKQTLDNLIEQKNFFNIFSESSNIHISLVEEAGKSEFLSYALQKIPEFLEESLLDGYQRYYPEASINIPNRISADSIDHLTYWVGEGRGKDSMDSIVVFNPRQMRLYQFETDLISIDDDKEINELVYGAMRALPKHYSREDGFNLYNFTDKDKARASKNARWKYFGIGIIPGLVVGGLATYLINSGAQVWEAMGRTIPLWLNIVKYASPPVLGVLSGIFSSFFADEYKAVQKAKDKLDKKHDKIWPFKNYRIHAYNVGPSIKSNMQAVQYLQ